ncbi:MAG: tetratricopeptide repeat protein [Deltaproteobacteria bacterium]|nr:MAG: tetratricopeptide repeat protein [Deltaproteobacteria bacterium]
MFRTSMLVFWTLIAVTASGMACKKAPEPPFQEQPEGSEPSADQPSTLPTPSSPSGKVSAGQVDRALERLALGTPAGAREALGILRALAKAEPENATVKYHLGLAHLQLEELPKAESAFFEATRLDASFGPAWLGLGVTQERSGALRSAVESYRTGVQADEENVELHAALVGALRRSGELDAAARKARDALKFNANSIALYNELGLVYMDKADYSMADFVFTRAINQVEGAGDDARIRSNFGWLLHLRGEAIRGRVQLERANDLEPDNLQTLVYLSNLYLDDRNYPDAVKLLERARTAEPENAGVLLNLGVAYRGVERFDDARQAYEKALSLRPDRVEPLLNLGILFGDYIKDYDKAASAFQRYIDKGGAKAELAREYIEGVEREKLRAERMRQREEERKQREQERRERERLLKESGDTAPEQPQPSPDSPWGNPQ